MALQRDADRSRRHIENDAGDDNRQRRCIDRRHCVGPAWLQQIDDRTERKRRDTGEQQGEQRP
jgi:hypothetical protein